MDDTPQPPSPPPPFRELLRQRLDATFPRTSWTTEGRAVKLGVSPATIRHWLAGSKIPTPYRAHRLSLTLDAPELPAAWSLARAERDAQRGNTDPIPGTVTEVTERPGVTGKILTVYVPRWDGTVAVSILRVSP